MPISREEEPLAGEHAGHAGARADQPAERAALFLLEQRAAGARSTRTAGTSRRCRPRRTRRSSALPSPGCMTLTISIGQPEAPTAAARDVCGSGLMPPRLICASPRIERRTLRRRERSAVLLEHRECPRSPSISGAAVKLTFCSNPCTTCGAIGSDTSASSWTVAAVPASSLQNRRAPPRPFGRTTATGSAPFLHQRLGARRDRAGRPWPSCSAVVGRAARPPPRAPSTSCLRKVRSILVDDGDRDRGWSCRADCRRPPRRSRRT